MDPLMIPSFQPFGRWFGPGAIDRFGRVGVLSTGVATALAEEARPSSRSSWCARAAFDGLLALGWVRNVSSPAGLGTSMKYP